MASKKDDKKDEGTISVNPQQQASAAASASINRAIEETRDSIKRTRREIPKYSEAMTDFQRQTVDVTREMADSFLESQRDIANSFQSAWTPAINSMMNFWFPYTNLPAAMAEAYTRTIATMAESLVTETRIINNMMVASMESIRTAMDYLRDNVKDVTRLTSNNARAAEEISRGIARSYSNSSFTAKTGSADEREEGRQRR